MTIAENGQGRNQSCTMLADYFGLRISSFLRHWVFRHSSLIGRGLRQSGAVQPGKRFSMHPLPRNSVVLILAVLCLIATQTMADDVTNPPAASKKPQRSPTFGGKQFWSDELIFHEWRIQRHALTSYCRLLDEEDYRRAGGTFAGCQEELERLKQKLEMPPMRGRIVLVLHGLLRSRQAMQAMCDYLEDKGDFQVLAVSYASSRRDMTAHATSLARVVTNLGNDVKEINFVGHSMGNLVIRRYLGGVCAVVPKERRLPRQTVMLAPPNNGSKLAERFRENNIFRSFWGISGIEIAELNKLEKHLATPPSFGIIAGGRGTENGNNPLIPGDDDFVVSVEETRLPGARDFLVVPALHGSIMENERVQECTLRFLQDGHFVASDQRQPIPIEVSPPDDRPGDQP